MGSVPDLDDDLEQYRLGGQIGKNALMGYLDDVGAALAQHREHGCELTGPVDDVESQLRQAALPRQLTGQHAGQKPCVDIAAAQHEPNPPPLETAFIVEPPRHPV